MAWKIVNNSEPDFKEEKFVGECPMYRKDAMITVFFLLGERCVKRICRKLIANLEENVICS